jgi:GNAT superfamily N-acetyltransferase
MAVSIRALTAQQTLPFIKAQWQFYKNDANWVPPLIMDRKKLLNQSVNPFFKNAEIQMFLAEDQGTVVGRIAAIVNHRHNHVHNDTVGFFGFFECVNNQDVANALFASAASWLKEKNRTSMRGPVNPSMNDECGLLVEGFSQPPVVLMTYNPPYYEALLLGAGLHKVKDLYAYLLENATYLSDKVTRLRNALVERTQLTFRSINFKDKQQFQKDVDTLRTVYNGAWQPNWGFVKMTDEEFNHLAADLKQIANPRFVFIAEVHGKVAGFCLALPDINQPLRHNRSGALVTGIWHLLTKRKRIDLVRIIVLGVLPEFQKLGIDAVMYHEIGARAKDEGILKGEASWILEDNEMMNRAATVTMKGTRYKTYRLFEKPI